MCDLPEKVPKSYELLSAAMSRTVEDNCNMKNMEAFRD
jgi:hypothetical protein